MKYEEYIDNEDFMDSEVEDGIDACDDFCTQKTIKPKTIEVEEVINTGESETITEVCIPLCPPAFEVLDDLIDKKVEFDALVASKCKVFINGRIIKDIPYKTRCKTCIPGCSNINKVTYGNIRHVTVEVPFALCIDVKGAYKGAKVVVLDYCVNSVEIPNLTECLPDRCQARCTPAYIKYDTCQRRLIKSITEKDCVWVKVKVVKDSIITVNTVPSVPSKDC